MEHSTVDAMVEYIRASNINLKTIAGNRFDNELIAHIVGYRSCDLLITLCKDTNKPSKYDLMIIDHITNTKKYVDVSVIKDHEHILQIYKSRKV